jgi:elongation factor G
VGKLSVFRVYQGTIKSNSEVWNAGREQSERIGQLYLPRGKAQENVAQVMAGDMGAIGKLSATVTGDTLSTRDNPVRLESMQFPVGYYGVAVVPGSKADLDKMSSALSRIVEEDPTLHLSRASDTNETLLTGLGEAQIEVAMDKIRRKFGADLKVRLPKVAYKETITQVTQTEYRHKKQSGGHGQYGHVWLEIEPTERGSGIVFENAIAGGVIPREYVPAVEAGVRQALDNGPLGGYPLVDLKIRLVDGSYHTVDSSEIAFRSAGTLAIRQAASRGKPVLLEPLVEMEVVTPGEFLGDIIGDLGTRRAQIRSIEGENDLQTVRALMPLGETFAYTTALRSLSSGRASFTMEFKHYEPVPESVLNTIIRTV